MKTKRTAGIILHPTSLPSPYGIGDIGATAHDFLEFLSSSGMSCWQVLPLGPTGYGDSPYQSPSAFAVNPLLISIDGLVEEGLLSASDLAETPGFASDYVDYDAVRVFKEAKLRKAYANFTSISRNYASFVADNAYWLDDYALYTAIQDHFIAHRKTARKADDYLDYYSRLGLLLSYNEIQDLYYGAVWNSWPEDIRKRESAAMKRWESELADDIAFVKFEQYILHEQWKKLHAQARKLGIKIIGDMPIFVSMDSSDVWANPRLFDIGVDGVPNAVAGVPPDYFSSTGQLWGNPLYNWEQCARTGYEWWIQRMKKAFEDMDIMRIDHFRGFESYWRIPYGAETAVSGSWQSGPGEAMFVAAKRRLGEMAIIAEDLGIITPEVTALRDALGYPGMAILQFAFESDAANAYLPHNFDTTNLAVYTGTHDNDTTRGWYGSASEVTRDKLRRYLGVSGQDIAWDMIRLAFSSVAAYAILPLQDVFSLGSEARMNTPSVATGNWRYKCTREMFAPEMAEGLRYLARMYNRA